MFGGGHLVEVLVDEGHGIFAEVAGFGDGPLLTTPSPMPVPSGPVEPIDTMRSCL